MKFDRKNLFSLLFIISFFVLGYLFINDRGLFADEQAHYLQIRRFISGDFGVYDIITVIPGYHFFLAGLAKIFGIYSIGGIRFLNLVIGLISIFIFLLLCLKISKYFYLAKGLQYAFFPILFPLFFLIYTDVLSLLLVLLMFYFLLSRNYVISGFYGMFSFFVRQNNIIWFAFMIAYVYFDRYGMKLDFTRLKEIAKDLWIFILGIIAAIIFFILNKGFSIGDRGMHPGGIFFGNIFFILFLFFFLFLPLNLYNFSKIIKFIKKNKWIQFVIIGIFLFYVKFFIVNHPYNLIMSNYFLRNAILAYFNSNFLIRSALFLPIAFSILSLCVTELRRKSFYLLYAFSFLFLLPSWLIEQRYYLIPFAFFILFKKEENKWVENLNILYYIVVSFILIYFIGSRIFFL